MTNPSILQHLPHCVDSAFLGFKQFQDEQYDLKIKQDHRLNEQDIALFQGTNLLSKVARSVCLSKTIRLKELLESIEFFLRVRKHLKAPKVKDICCGHGLVGLLFAIFEEHIQEVELIDIKFNPSQKRLLNALTEIAPWLNDKVKCTESKLSDLIDQLKHTQSSENSLENSNSDHSDLAIFSVHACGQQSDLTLKLAQIYQAKVAIMPCCYPPKIRKSYDFLKDQLGVILTLDIQRSQDLQDLGYQVQWLEIPSKITPMNRIIVAQPKQSIDSLSQSSLVSSQPSLIG